MGGIHMNFGVRHAGLEQVGAKGEPQLKKAEASLNRMFGGASAATNKLLDKIANFGDKDAEKLMKGLEKFSDNAVATLKEWGSKIAHELNKASSGELKKMVEGMGLKFPKQSTSGKLRDAANDCFGKKNIDQFMGFASKVKAEAKKGGKELKAEVKAGFKAAMKPELSVQLSFGGAAAAPAPAPSGQKSATSLMAEQIKARYRPR
jgi:hypothetical protein